MLRKILFSSFALLFAAILSNGCVVKPEKVTLQQPTHVRIAAWNMKWFPTGYPTYNPITLGEEKNPIPHDEKIKTKKPTEKQLNRIKYRINQAAEQITKEEADIIILEEVRSYEICEMLTKEASAAYTNDLQVDSCTVFPTYIDAAVPAHQNAIISHANAIASGWQEWEEKDGIKPPRGFVWAIYELNDIVLMTIGVHLKSNYISDDEPDPEAAPLRNRAMRELSTKQLVEFCRTMQQKDHYGRKITDIIIGGDFNTSVFDKNYDGEKTIPTLLEAGFKDCHEGVPNRNTMGASKKYPATCFDYLFHLGNAEILSPVVAKDTKISDHRLISILIKTK